MYVTIYVHASFTHAQTHRRNSKKHTNTPSFSTNSEGNTLEANPLINIADNSYTIYRSRTMVTLLNIVQWTI